MGNKGSKEQKYEAAFDENIYLKENDNYVVTQELKTIRDGKRNVVSFVKKDISPKGIVLISHGLHEHALRHTGVAYALIEKNFVVYAIDHVSHGKSDGDKGLILDYKTLVADFVELSKIVQASHPNLPTYVFSHSMGTLVAILAANEIVGLEGLLLSASPVHSGPGSSSPFGFKCLYPITQTSFGQTLTSILSNMDPKGQAAPIDPKVLTSDPEEIHIHSQDTLIYHGWIMNKTAFELLKMIPDVKEMIPKLKVPILCIHGTADTISYPDSSEYIIQHVASEKKQIKLYDGLVHELTHEKLPQRDEVIRDIVTFYEDLYNTRGSGNAH